MDENPVDYTMYGCTVPCKSKYALRDVLVFPT
jgi:hypothetical protein